MKGERRDALGDKVEELGGNLVTQGGPCGKWQGVWILCQV